MDDLDETGSKAVSVAIQMLGLIPQKPSGKDDHGADFDWWWSRKYIQIQSSKDSTLQKRNFVMRTTSCFWNHPFAIAAMIVQMMELKKAPYQYGLFEIRN
jgi:hypothetical protein